MPIQPFHGEPTHPPNDAPVVLMLTHHRDHFVPERVAAALARRGACPVRVNTDLFPSRLLLTTELGTDDPCYLLDGLLDDGTALDGRRVRAIWTRSAWPPVGLDEVPAEHRLACERESREALVGFLDGLAGARWVNPFHRQVEASNKLRQLRLAEAAGLSIPRTVVSNDAERIRRFAETVDGGLVAKMFHALSHTMDRSGPFVPTSDVTPGDLEHLEGLRIAPMIFQEKIAKARELRVVFVAGRALAGAVDARQSRDGQTDWRQAGVDEIGWQHAELPPPTVVALGRLMDALGLVVGAIDLVETLDGGHVFLEVNPMGEWGMLERDLDLPISEAIAAALLADSSHEENPETVL